MINNLNFQFKNSSIFKSIIIDILKNFTISIHFSKSTQHTIYTYFKSTILSNKTSYHFILMVDGGAMTQQQLHNFKMAATSSTLQRRVPTLQTVNNYYRRRTNTHAYNTCMHKTLPMAHQDLTKCCLWGIEKHTFKDC